jgi:hypothetical protein
MNIIQWQLFEDNPMRRTGLELIIAGCVHGGGGAAPPRAPLRHFVCGELATGPGAGVGSRSVHQARSQHAPSENQIQQSGVRQKDSSGSAWLGMGSASGEPVGAV